MKRLGTRWLLPALSMLLPLLAVAQPSLYEIEPNDTPAEATGISGEVVVIGSLSGGDQDAYKWTVSDVDARRRWSFELQGVPGQLTIVEVIRVDYADNGVDVAGIKRLFKMGTRDGSAPSVHEDMIFEPGEYILGIAGAGGGGGFRPPVDRIRFDEAGVEADPTGSDPGGYRLAIREGSKLSLENKPKERSTKASARKLRLNAENAAYLDSPEAWYLLEITGKQAGQRWDVDGQVPVGRQARVTLYAGDGAELAKTRADGKGRFLFPDLGLEPGSYHIGLEGHAAGFIRAVSVQSVGHRIDGAEAEPNDQWKLANRVDLSQPLTGRMGSKGETDLFAFTLDETVTDRVLTLQLETADEHALTLCLLDGKGGRIQCRSNPGTVELVDLVLQPGHWGLEVSRGPEAAEYIVTLVDQGAIQAGVEAEPNDRIEQAAAVPANNRVKGRFSGRQEDDYFKFIVTEEPQLWRFQVIGDEVHELAYHDASGHQSQVYRIPKGQGRVRLDNLYLLPGIHHVRVTGRDGGRYTLLARPIGPPDPNGEFEPNDDTSRMQALRFEQTRTGLLQDKQDKDNYRFHLGHWDRFRLTIQPPPDGEIKAQVYWDGKNFKEFNKPVAGREVVLEGLFPPGDYRLELRAGKTSEAEYKASLERLARFGCPTDCEPNDNVDFASSFPADHVLEGYVNTWRDSDWYALPVFAEPTGILVSGEIKRQIEVVDRSYSAQSLIKWDKEATAWRGTIPAGVQTYLQVPAWGEPPYRFEVSFPGGPVASPRPAQIPMELQFDLETREVGAYLAYGQQVGGTLSVANTGSSPLSVDLETATSDFRWQVDLEKSTLAIPAGGSRSTTLMVHVPADSWADRPVRISARASTEAGGQVESFVDVISGRETPPVNPVHGWALPEGLRGGFNVARDVLGGRWTGEKDTAVGTGFPALFDGMAVENQGLALRGGQQPRATGVIVELAGDEPVEVVGFTLNSLSGAEAGRFLRNVDFALSSDGREFTPVIEDDLLPIRAEQAFVLERPIPARFARLRLKYGFDGQGKTAVGLGEIKVIAKPGFDLTWGKGFNIADPQLGGHVVWSQPQIAGSRWDVQILTSEEENPRVRTRPGEAMELVVGFHHDRAAQITGLEWVASPAVKEDARVKSVAVSVSQDSPLGPWQAAGDWTLAAGGGSDTFDLGPPVWARFVRLSAPGLDKLKWRAWPETLRVLERPTDDEYRSILTEWGFASQAAIYEALHPPRIDPPFVPAGHDSKDKAAPLDFGQFAGGQVVLGQHEHWYKLAVPDGENTLSIQVGGDPSVRTIVHLENVAGEAIPVRKLTQQSTPRLHSYQAVVEPGRTCYLKIEEPPRNVVFLWDTSASVGAYLPVIYNALGAYAADLVPGRDAANLIPFGGGLLLDDWYGDPYIMQTILNDYPRKENSSEAEQTLRTASEALALRAGTKAIVMVTDAATGRHSQVWDEFQRVQPRVFGLGVGSQGAFGRNPVLEQDLMQDWSRVNGGIYTYLLNAGEMEVAFDRAATMLRRPAGYSVEVVSTFIEAPGPGSLQVIARDATAVSGGAVELILDASGSMLKRLDGKRRIDIAKEVLSEVVNGQIPAGTPVALRVFGHKEPNACRTDLEMPLTPLDPAKAGRKIKGVNAMNLARTPIADSLAKVESDLRKATGRKMVVLITDGEETCDGKPEEVIRKLQDKGFDLSLNIVGFAIDDAALEARFKGWTELGGGRYFSARSREGLSESLSEALQIPFVVYDTAGTLVTEGVVGGPPRALEQGIYRVVVQSSPARTFEQVEIVGEKEVVLEAR